MVEKVFEGLSEKSGRRSRTNCESSQQRINREAVKLGEMRCVQEVLRVANPQFGTKTTFPEAYVREGVHELTLRESEFGVKWRLLVVDKDWHALTHATNVGVDQAESSKANLLWRVCENKTQREE